MRIRRVGLGTRMHMRMCMHLCNMGRMHLYPLRRWGLRMRRMHRRVRARGIFRATKGEVMGMVIHRGRGKDKGMMVWEGRSRTHPIQGMDIHRVRRLFFFCGGWWL